MTWFVSFSGGPGVSKLTEPGFSARPATAHGARTRFNGGVFTGLIREVGTVVSRRGGAAGVRLEVDAPQTAAAAAVGDSVAIDGVCLTVVARHESSLAFDAVPETLDRTALATLESGSRVNLEPALRAGEPLGGHYVQGHVDGVGSIRSVEPEGQGERVWVDAPPELLRYAVEKGSVTVDGVSLTVAALDARGFAVALIPHTLAETTLGDLRPGRQVNREADVLAKYVERLTAR
jgi:riboflavin synthase